MKQFVLPDSVDGSDTIEITGEDYHYLTRVLRKRPGERFRGTRPDGRAVSIVFKTDSGKNCVLEIANRLGGGPADRLEISLFQCLPKARKMDLIIRQATETGVAAIIPVCSAHSVPRIREENVDKKLQRWRRIARQAMQQSGCPVLPEICPPVGFDEFPRAWGETASPSDVSLFFHQEPLDGPSFHNLFDGAPGRVGICIGPEGGGSEEEVSTLLQSGFQPVYIKTNVLRTETAALYAIAAVQTVLLEKVD